MPSDAKQDALLDFDTLTFLQREHPAWRLLRSDHAPFIIAFLQRSFLAANERTIPEIQLITALEEDLFLLRHRFGEEHFPRSARHYLTDWASPEKGWLRKFYPRDSDEPAYDLVPTVERAIAWLAGLRGRSFVGTESRLLLLFDLLRQMTTGSETDPQARLADLEKKRDAIEAEIAAVKEGKIRVLDDTALRDRFQQFTTIARDLLSDFREVEQNFRQLDRAVRERIALWDGTKAELLDEIMGRRDAIDDSDQGRSFRAFWDFLMSNARQQELSDLLTTVLAHPAVASTQPDPHLRRIHYDWLRAGDHTQRTVADLSAQLRRFLDDQAWLENRRIMDLLRGIEKHALAIRETPPSGRAFTHLAEFAAAINLPFERPLYSPPFKPALNSVIEAATKEDIDTSALYEIERVDKAALTAHIRQSLREESQITLSRLVDSRPPEHGLAEIIAYLELGHHSGQHTPFRITVDESVEDTLRWTSTTPDGQAVNKTARLPRVIFLRS